QRAARSSLSSFASQLLGSEGELRERAADPLRAFACLFEQAQPLLAGEVPAERLLAEQRQLDVACLDVPELEQQRAERPRVARALASRRVCELRVGDGAHLQEDIADACLRFVLLHRDLPFIARMASVSAVTAPCIFSTVTLVS